MDTGTECGWNSAAWRQVRNGDIEFWQAAAAADWPGLVHGFTPRGLDMAWRNGADAAAVRARRTLVCTALGLPIERLCVGRQVHGVTVTCADDVPPGGAAVLPAEGVDGWITRTAGVPLMVLTADCPLVLLYDGRCPALGLAHCGWRGAVAGLPAEILARMEQRYGTAPADVRVLVAPSAGPCCYEVGPDVLACLPTAAQRVGTLVDPVRAGAGRPTAGPSLPQTGVSPARPVLHRAGRTHLDLWTLIAGQLAARGVPAAQVYLPAECTICNPGFYSYRREGPGVGQSALLAALRA